jgi:hypothetical protein
VHAARGGVGMGDCRAYVDSGVSAGTGDEARIARGVAGAPAAPHVQAAFLASD